MEAELRNVFVVGSTHVVGNVRDSGDERLWAWLMLVILFLLFVLLLRIIDWN